MKKIQIFKKFILPAGVICALAACALRGGPERLIECGAETGLFDAGTVVIIAMHGIPPRNSEAEVAELMMLEALIEAGSVQDPAKIQRLEELDSTLKNRPLEEKNPYWQGAVKLGELLEQKIGARVFVCFNEFCAPSLEKAFEDAAKEKPSKIMVLSTLSAPGNDHAANPEGDILKSVLDAREKYTGIEIAYAWPYRFDRLARLLKDQLLEFSTQDELADPSTRVVLACHGTPPLDAPQKLLTEYMMLHGAPRIMGSPSDKRHDELEEKIRSWPRTDNDPYWAGTVKLAQTLGEMIGSDVIVAYNEFCAPGIEEAFRQAVSVKAKKIIAISPMWEPNNPHAKMDIGMAVNRAKRRNPGTEILYAWPYDYDKVVAVLCGQLREFQDKPGFTGS